MSHRHALALLLVCWLSSVASAQPVVIGWRPPAGCSSGQAIVWNGSAWVCGSPTGTITTSSDFAGNGSSGTPLDLSTAVTAPGSLAVATTLGVTGLSTLTGGATIGAETIVSGGAIGDRSTNGIHFGFASNVGTISSTQPGTANRQLDIQGTPIHLNVSGSTEISITGIANTIADPTTFNGTVTISRGAGAPPALELAQTGQATWTMWQNASTDPLLFHNTVAGNSVCTMSTAGVLNCVGGLSTPANLTAGDNVADVHAITGGLNINAASTGRGIDRALGIAGTDWTTLIHYDTTEWMYLRGGKNASKIIIGDVNTGTVEIGSNSNQTTVLGNFQAGDASTDRVGIGIAPDANHAMTFAAALGNKIALYPLSGTAAYGFGIQTGQLQYFAGGDTTSAHVFGYGDSDAFAATHRLEADGDTFLGVDDADAALVRGGFTVQKTAADSTARVAITNDEQSWNIDTRGASGNGFFINGSTGGDVFAIGTNGQIYVGDNAGVTAIGNDVTVLNVGNTGTHTGASFVTTLGNFAAAPTVARHATDPTGVYGVKMTSTMTTTGDACAPETNCGTDNVLLVLNATGGDSDVALDVEAGTARFAEAVSANAGLSVTGALSIDTSSLSVSGGTLSISTNGQPMQLAATTVALTGGLSVASSTGLAGLTATGAVDFESTLNVDGAVTIAGTISDPDSFVIIADSVSVTGGVLEVAGSIRDSDSAEVTINDGLIVADHTTLGGNLSVAADTTFSNGPSGINNYAGTHLEWKTDLVTLVNPTTAINAPIEDGWQANTSANSAWSTTAGTTTRPGIQDASTLTSATGRAALYIGNPAGGAAGHFDFGSGTWTYESVVGFTTLSVVAQEYASVQGFADDTTLINIVDGCYFLYDRVGTATDPGTGDATGTPGDKWQIWCAANGVRTGYILDGTATEDSFTGVDSPVAALTLPSTNIDHMKIVVEGTALARFYIDYVEVGRITTNIPSGAARLTGAVASIIKSAGTTARTMTLDFARVAVDLTAARTP